MADTPTTDAAFRKVFDATLTEVRRFCVRRLPPSDVNDAVSEVYLVAWRKFDEIPDGAEALAWLYAVARNVVRNMERSHRRTLRLRARLAREPLPTAAVEIPLVRHAEDENLAAAFATLSPADREAIRLRAWEGLSTPEIASVLGCSVAAAEKRVSRALNRLRQHYATATDTPVAQPVRFRGGDT